MKQECSPYFVIYMDLSLGFVTWIRLNLNWLLAVTGVMHETVDAYSIRSTWSCYWLDQFLTLALNILILSIFYISMDLSTNYFAHFSGCWVSFVCSCHSILECCVTFSGVKLSIRSFVLFRWPRSSLFCLSYILKNFCAPYMPFVGHLIYWTCLVYGWKVFSFPAMPFVDHILHWISLSIFHQSSFLSPTSL